MSPIMRKQVDNVNQPTTPSGDEVLELVHSVMHRFRSQQYQLTRDGPHDITHMEGKVLWFFSRHPGATQSDLVSHSGRDKAQLARLIKGLVERGLLERSADDADRRNVRLTPTADGHAVQRALQQQSRRVGVQAVRGLDEAERRQLAALLQRVKDNLDPST